MAADLKAHQRTLVGAEILRIRRRRALMITLAVLGFGILAFVGALLEILHAANPARFGPPGGTNALNGFGGALSELGAIAGILIGAAAGSADLSAGVLRSIVSTGRPRSSLFLARVPAVLAIVVPVVVVTWTAISCYSVGLAFGNAEPTTSLMAREGAWALLDIGVYTLVALAFSAIVGSRSVTVGVLLGVSLVVSPLLAMPGWRSYIGIRQLFFGVSLRWIAPYQILLQARVHGFRMTEAGWYAGLVIAVWVVGILVCGLWRTVRRDV